MQFPAFAGLSLRRQGDMPTSWGIALTGTVHVHVIIVMVRARHAVPLREYHLHAESEMFVWGIMDTGMALNDTGKMIHPVWDELPILSGHWYRLR